MHTSRKRNGGSFSTSSIPITHYIPLAILAIFLSATAAGNADTVVIPPAIPESTRYGLGISEDYQVEINGRKVPVYTATICRLADTEPPIGAREDIDPLLTQASFTTFAFDGKATVTIRPTTGIKTPVIHPLSSGVVPQVADDAISLSLSKPANLMLEIGHGQPPSGNKANPPRAALAPSRPLFVFANPIINRPDGNVKYFAPGIHKIGHLRIESGQTLFLDAGAVLNGTLFADGATNIQVIGYGILDGSRTEHYSNLAIDLHNCRNVVIDGIIVRDSPHWTVVPTRCENVLIRNVKVLNWRINGDGIDVCNSRRVRVENCFLYTSDDSISIKGCNAFHKDAAEWNVEDVTIADSTLMAGFSAFGVRIGDETRAPLMQNLTFTNLDFYISGNTFGILAGDRAPIRNVVLQDSRIERYFGWVYVAEIKKGQFNHDKEYGSIEGLIIKNLDVQATWGEGASELLGYDADHMIKDVLFENVRILGKPLTGLDQYPGRIYPLKRPTTENFVDNVRFIPSPTPLPTVH